MLVGDVRWRDDRLGRFLEVVGRQHVVGRRDEGLEEAPGPSGDQAQTYARRPRPAGAGPRPGATGLPEARRPARRTRRPRTPRPAARCRCPHMPPRRSPAAADRPGPPPCVGRSARRPDAAERRVGRRDPFEKVAARYREPDQGANDGVAHQPGLVRQEDDHQAGLDERKAQLRAQGAEMAAERHARAARRDIRHHGNKRRQDDRRQDEGGPDAPRPEAAWPIRRSAPRRPTAADSDRRRLSSIFQRPIAGTLPRGRRSALCGPRPRIQGSSCQSPRAQRWWRRAATS